MPSAYSTTGDDPSQLPAPAAVRLADRFAALRAVAGYGVAIGPLPERASDYVRR